MSFTYLLMLAVSLSGLLLIDWRRKLAFFASPGRAAATLLIPTVFFLIWDASGIALGIFFRGQAELLTGVMIAPQMPIEEPVFLLLLCYTCLVIFRTLETKRAKE